MIVIGVFRVDNFDVHVIDHVVDHVDDHVVDHDDDNADIHVDVCNDTFIVNFLSSEC